MASKIERVRAVLEGCDHEIAKVEAEMAGLRGPVMCGPCGRSWAGSGACPYCGSAANQVSDLMRLWKQGDPNLTFVAEALGKVLGEPGSLALAALLPLLEHPKAYIREGVLLGLAGHLGIPAVRHAVCQSAAFDDVPEIRQLAHEILEG